MTGARQRLIEAAQAELIAGEGHLEMQAVAKRAQVSVGLAYHHFGSKAGLIAAVVEAFYGRLEQTVFGPPQWPFNSWAEREKGRISAYIAFHYAHPFAPLVLGALSRAPEVLDVETNFTKRQQLGGARMLMAAQAERILPGNIDPHTAIAMMTGGIRQVLHFAMTQKPRTPAEQLTDDIWAFISAGLRLPTTTSA